MIINYVGGGNLIWYWLSINMGCVWTAPDYHYYQFLIIFHLLFVSFNLSNKIGLCDIQDLPEAGDSGWRNEQLSGKGSPAPAAAHFELCFYQKKSWTIKKFFFCKPNTFTWDTHICTVYYQREQFQWKTCRSHQDLVLTLEPSNMETFVYVKKLLEIKFLIQTSP